MTTEVDSCANVILEKEKSSGVLGWERKGERMVGRESMEEVGRKLYVGK